MTELLVRHLEDHPADSAIIILQEGFNLAAIDALLYHRIPYRLIKASASKLENDPYTCRCVPSMIKRAVAGAFQIIGDNDLETVHARLHPALFEWIAHESSEALLAFRWPIASYCRRLSAMSSRGDTQFVEMLAVLQKANIPIHNFYAQMLKNIRWVHVPTQNGSPH